jgi:hypothetical protein
MYENKERKKKQQTIPGVDPGTQKKRGVLNVIKQL